MNRRLNYLIVSQEPLKNMGLLKSPNVNTHIYKQNRYHNQIRNIKNSSKVVIKHIKTLFDICVKNALHFYFCII